MQYPDQGAMSIRVQIRNFFTLFIGIFKKFRFGFNFYNFKTNVSGAIFQYAM